MSQSVGCASCGFGERKLGDQGLETGILDIFFGDPKWSILDPSKKAISGFCVVISVELDFFDGLVNF